MDITITGNEITFNENIFVVSKTDTKGNITYCNDTFTHICGYSEDELIGAPHNIIRHKDMPKFIFKLLWGKIQAGEEIFAYVKNLTKSGKYYWVHAYVTPTFDVKTNKIIGYHSVRRSPNPQAIKIIEPIYKKMIQVEQRGGMEASEKVFNDTLSSLGVTYEQFILSYE